MQVQLREIADCHDVRPKGQFAESLECFYSATAIDTDHRPVEEALKKA